MQTAAICTLFEKDYHFGAAILFNSIVSSGFEGNIYAGYRPPSPPWISKLNRIEDQGIGNSDGFQINGKCNLFLVPVSFSGHLTNRKPDFMLDLMNWLPPETDALFYMDPDLILNEGWQFFIEWVSCGVALCEDVNSPVHFSHPRRIGWRKTFVEKGIKMVSRDSCYANGGFLGVGRGEVAFLHRWKEIQEVMWEILGGAEFAGIPGGKKIGSRSGFCGCFSKTDQDALNAAIEASPDIPVSFIGREAMGFCNGNAPLPHALGPCKPWRRNYLFDSLKASPPRLVDKLFWNHARVPIPVYGAGSVALKKLSIAAASFLGRFYKRN